MSSLLGTSYARDGRVYGSGPFASGLDEAVAGNSRAESEAHAAQQFSVAGFVLEVAGVGAMGTGVGLAATHDSELREAGTWVALGGAAALITGMIITANASNHASTAVAIYNDAIDAKLEGGSTAESTADVATRSDEQRAHEASSGATPAEK